MGKTIALLCLLASTVGAYDLRGIEPGKALTADALPTGVTCEGHLCHGFLPVLTFTTVVDIIKDDDGTVIDVTASYGSASFAELSSALTAKYGKPQESATVPKINSFGARMSSRVRLWKSAGYQMLLDEHTDISNGSLSIRKLDAPQQSAGI